MIVFAGGDAHGSLTALYSAVQMLELDLDVKAAHLFHVGDLGIWPDPGRVDRATRNHDEAGEFARWRAAGLVVPVPTTFVAGNHEDHDFLARLPPGRPEVLPGLRHLPTGDRLRVAGLVVGGIGGCHSPSDFERPSAGLRGGRRRHYTREDCDRLSHGGRLDVLVTHDAPTGVAITRHAPDGGRRPWYVTQAAGLAEVVEATRPIVAFFGHHHARVDAVIAGVPCIGLARVGRPGAVVAVELDLGGRTCAVRGESE